MSLASHEKLKLPLSQRRFTLVLQNPAILEFYYLYWGYLPNEKRHNWHDPEGVGHIFSVEIGVERRYLFKAAQLKSSPCKSCIVPGLISSFPGSCSSSLLSILSKSGKGDCLQRHDPHRLTQPVGVMLS